MKKILLTSTFLLAFSGIGAAADAVTVEPTPMPETMAPDFTWTGWYVGLHTGGGASRVGWAFDFPGATADHNGDGWLGGFQAGYNYQMNNWVFGVEGDVSVADLDGNASCPNPEFSCDSEIDVLGTVRARAGYNFDRLLLYATGGVAFGRIDISTNDLVEAGNVSGTKKTRAGWTAGAGVEYAFTDKLSLKGEYRYVDLGESSYTVDFGANVNADVKAHIGLVGLNYKF